MEQMPLYVWLLSYWKPVIKMRRFYLNRSVVSLFHVVSSFEFSLLCDYYWWFHTDLICSYLCEVQLQQRPSEFKLLWPFILSLQYRVTFCVMFVGFVTQHCSCSSSEICSIKYLIPTKVAINLFNLLKVCQLSY